MSANDLHNLLKGLTPEQLSFVRERMTATSDAEAARRVGVHPTTICKWKAAGAPLDEIVALAKLDTVEVARERLRRLTDKAVGVLDRAMDHSRKDLAAAQDVLDRMGVKEPTRVDVTSKGEKLSGGDDYRTYLDNRISDILAAIAAASPVEQPD